MVKLKSKSDLLFELSWEVCNKVGGIYTVVASKAALMKKEFSKYFLIGPYVEKKAKLDFIQSDTPKEFSKIFSNLKEEGIICHFGTWNIKGEPNTILIEYISKKDQINEIKTQLWHDYKIDSLRATWDFEEPMLWSICSGRFIEEYAKNNQEKISVQCHEWLSAFAILYLKKKEINVATVFTTHATMLGRALAGNNYDLYNILDKIDPAFEAKKIGVEAKYTTELACANTTDVFSTVSETTAIEAERLLKRNVDIIVPNGLDITKFPTIEETSIKHITVREKIREFLRYYFYPYYSFDMEHNLIMFTLARYEFRNKGLDVLISALGKLNEQLKKEDSKRTVSFFFWVPAPNKGRRIEILENKTYYRHIKNYVNFHSDEIINKIVSTVLSKTTMKISSIFSKEFLEQLRKDQLRFQRRGLPPLSTHYMDEENDAMISALKANGLLNREEDKVKIIIYPVYLDGADEILDLTYYDTIAGCHLGVFPSYYEPYGYTPLEGAALGVSSITTDMAGFGRFINASRKSKKQQGIFVIDRMGKNENEFVTSLYEKMLAYCKLNHYERVQNKTAAKSQAALADWQALIQNYIQAHNMALEKISKKRG